MNLKVKLLRVWVILKHAVLYFIRDDGSALAGYMAYTALLCLFPFLIFATALTGLLIGVEGITPVMEFLYGAIPGHVAETIRPVLEEVVANRSGKVLGFSALGAIWVASNGFEALRVGLERAYQTTALRSFWVNRLISIGFVFCAVIAFTMLAVLIVFGPQLAALAREYTGIFELVQDYIGIKFSSGTLWNYFRYAAGALILIAFLVALHWFLPGKRPGVPILRGVLFTVFLWMLLATAFSIYFQFVPSYAVTYGTLGGVIATLLFFYVSSAIFIFGAEINSAAGAGENRIKAEIIEDDQPTSAPMI